MAISTTVNMIYIGNLASTDPTEGDDLSEDAAAILGSYDRSGMEVVSVENVDGDEDGSIADDESDTDDYVNYSLGGGPVVSQKADSSMLYKARITELDGTVHDIQVVVVQMQNGDTFVTDELDNGTLDNLNIRTIELTAVNTDNAAGYYSNQSVDNTIACFVRGTRILTPGGPVPVEDLAPGDAVTCADGIARPLRGTRAQDFPVTNAATAPVLIPAGALGNGLPQRDLRLSPQHRLALASPIVRRIFGAEEVLAPARLLTALPRIRRDPPGGSVAYLHLILDRHRLIFAEGAPAETLLAGPVARRGLPHWARLGPAPVPVRPIPPMPALRRLIARHARNPQHALCRGYLSSTLV